MTGPDIVVIAGPNGAGKTTSAPRLLRDTFQVDEFVNADNIAVGLSAFAPETTAIAAGRIMLKRLNELASLRRSFAFETTLASRSFHPWMKVQIEQGFSFRLLFLWLPTPEMAVTRVHDRVLRGGHTVPADVVHRRYHRGLRNFFDLYQPIATSWQVFDSSTPILSAVASGEGSNRLEVIDSDVWSRMQRGRNDPAEEA
jgi:predicted ABC-type ATPase